MAKGKKKSPKGRSGGKSDIPQFGNKVQPNLPNVAKPNMNTRGNSRGR